jgi:hypothetical protein
MRCLFCHKKLSRLDLGLLFLFLFLFLIFSAFSHDWDLGDLRAHGAGGGGGGGGGGVEVGRKNRWEIFLRMRYNLRGLRERDLGRVNIVI